MILALSALLMGCTETSDDTADTTDSTVADDTGEQADPTFTISGSGFDFATQSAEATAGRCLDIVDPELALVTGELDDLVILGSTVIDDAGAWTVEGVSTTSQIGLFAMLTSCDGPEAIPTGSGIAYDDYATLEDGAELSGVLALQITKGLAGLAINPSFEAIGREGTDIAVEGMMLGYVEDAAGVPVQGATVAGEDEAFMGYIDTDNDNSGLLATDGVPNAFTLQEYGGWFASPGAPISNYTATHESMTFETKTFGSLPGVVTVFKFTADQ